MIKYTHYEIDGESAVLYNNDDVVDKIDLTYLVEEYLAEHGTYQQI